MFLALLPIVNTDELSGVAFAINGMLAALERSQHELRGNEKSSTASCSSRSMASSWRCISLSEVDAGRGACFA
jgi:hypothetical protein